MFVNFHCGFLFPLKIMWVLGTKAVTHRSSQGTVEATERRDDFAICLAEGKGSVEAWIHAGWWLWLTGNNYSLFIPKYSNDAWKLGKDKGDVKENGEDNDIWEEKARTGKYDSMEEEIYGEGKKITFLCSD